MSVTMLPAPGAEQGWAPVHMQACMQPAPAHMVAAAMPPTPTQPVSTTCIPAGYVGEPVAMEGMPAPGHASPTVATQAPLHVGSYAPPMVAAAAAPAMTTAAYTPAPAVCATPAYPATVVVPQHGMPAHGMPAHGAPFSPMQVPGMSALNPPEITAGSLTQGFPDPACIEEQKQAYSKSLDMQFEHGTKSLHMQNDERKRLLHQAAEQRKQSLVLKVEQEMRLHEMLLDEQTNQALMGLKKAALDQRAALEQQAAALTLEYQQRKMHEEFAATQAQMQKQYAENQAKLQSEAQKYYDEEASQVSLQDPGGHPVQAQAPMVPQLHFAGAPAGARPTAFAAQPGVSTVYTPRVAAAVRYASPAPAAASHVLPHGPVPQYVMQSPASPMMHTQSQFVLPPATQTTVVQAPSGAHATYGTYSVLQAPAAQIAAAPGHQAVAHSPSAQSVGGAGVPYGYAEGGYNPAVHAAHAATPNGGYVQYQQQQ